MAGKGRPRTIVCDHEPPAILGHLMNERYICPDCGYIWIVSVSPFKGKKYWRELGK